MCGCVCVGAWVYGCVCRRVGARVGRMWVRVSV